MTANADAAAGRRQHAAEHGQERGLAAAGRPHQQGQLAADQRQVDALERVHAPGAFAEHLHDVGRLDHGLCHRANTMAGSMRVTTRIAETAAIAHMTTVSTNRPSVSMGVITIGSGASVVAFTSASPIEAAIEKPMTALSSAWPRMTVRM